MIKLESCDRSTAFIRIYTHQTSVVSFRFPVVASRVSVARASGFRCLVGACEIDDAAYKLGEVALTSFAAQLRCLTWRRTVLLLYLTTWLQRRTHLKGEFGTSSCDLRKRSFLPRIFCWWRAAGCCAAQEQHNLQSNATARVDREAFQPGRTCTLYAGCTGEAQSYATAIDHQQGIKVMLLIKYCQQGCCMLGNWGVWEAMERLLCWVWLGICWLSHHVSLPVCSSQTCWCQANTCRERQQTEAGHDVAISPLGEVTSKS